GLGGFGPPDGGGGGGGSHPSGWTGAEDNAGRAEVPGWTPGDRPDPAGDTSDRSTRIHWETIGIMSVLPAGGAREKAPGDRSENRERAWTGGAANSVKRNRRRAGEQDGRGGVPPRWPHST